MRKRVVIESPYGGDNGQVARNIKYVRACKRDSLERGEAPFASHSLYTQPGVLNDNSKEEREWGMNAGWDLVRDFELTAVYCDLGISQGMLKGIRKAKNLGRKVIFRKLGSDWEKNYDERWKNHPHRDLF